MRASAIDCTRGRCPASLTSSFPDGMLSSSYTAASGIAMKDARTSRCPRQDPTSGTRSYGATTIATSQPSGRSQRRTGGLRSFGNAHYVRLQNVLAPYWSGGRDPIQEASRSKACMAKSQRGSLPCRTIDRYTSLSPWIPGPDRRGSPSHQMISGRMPTASRFESHVRAAIGFSEHHADRSTGPSSCFQPKK